MLQDRSYMRRDNRRDQDRGPDAMKWLFGLIAVNVLMFLAGMDPHLKNMLTVQPEAVYHFEVWRLVTALFLHEGFFHLFFNMFGLYFFGVIAVQLLGGKKFLWLFFSAGIFGNLLWLAFNFNNPFFSLLGASGGVMGVIMAAAMMRPDVQVYMLFIPFPIKMKTLAVVYVILELVNQITAPYSSVAYLAHLGGFFAGYIFMRIFAPGEILWDPLKPSAPGTQGRVRPDQNSSGWRMTEYDPRKGGPVPRHEIDRLLDKLSQSGINSLSEAEQETLRRAREEMMKHGRR